MSGTYIAGSGWINHETLGKVFVTVRANARQFTARWKADGVHVTAPSHTTMAQLVGVLDSMAPRLEAKRPAEADLSHGRVYDFGDVSVTVLHTGRAGTVSVRPLPDRCYELLLPQGTAAPDPALTRAIQRIMDRVGEYEGQFILLPLARRIADELGCRPRSWQVGRGRRKLGHCTPAGDILLSGVLTFYPEELRRYIICHELAHLTEMNHSPRFHALCDRYCGGREAELTRMLKAYKPPF